MRVAFYELTPQQRAVFATVSHFYELIGEPVAGSYVGRKLGISKQRVAVHFRELNRLGWLAGPAAPAVPARRLPPHRG